MSLTATCSNMSPERFRYHMPKEMPCVIAKLSGIQVTSDTCATPTGGKKDLA